MKRLLKLIGGLIFGILLSGCLASTTSPDGINCNAQTEKGPTWDWPLVCQPNGG